MLLFGFGCSSRLFPRRGADDSNHFDFRQGRSWQPDPLGVAARIGRRKEKPIFVQQADIVFSQTFKDISVFELDPQPKSLTTRPSGKDFSDESLGVVDFTGVKVSDETNPFNILNCDG